MPRQLRSRFRTAVADCNCETCLCFFVWLLTKAVPPLTRSSGANHRACRATQHHELADRALELDVSTGCALRSLARVAASRPYACARRRPQHRGPAQLCKDEHLLADCSLSTHKVRPGASNISGITDWLRVFSRLIPIGAPANASGSGTQSQNRRPLSMERAAVAVDCRQTMSEGGERAPK